MKNIYLAALIAGSVLLMGGCAATYVPVVGSMTPTPTPTMTPTPKPTVQPTETPIAIITTVPEIVETPVPVSLTPIADADDYLKTIGEKTEGESVFRIKIVNNTGLDIKKFRIVSTLASYYGDEANYVNLLRDGDIFADKEERILYYDTWRDPSNDAEEKHYDLELSFTDESNTIIKDVPFSDMKDASLCCENGQAYFIYVSETSMEKLSTKEG